MKNGREKEQEVVKDIVQTFSLSSSPSLFACGVLRSVREELSSVVKFGEVLMVCFLFRQMAAPNFAKEREGKKKILCLIAVTGGSERRWAIRRGEENGDQEDG